MAVARDKGSCRSTRAESSSCSDMMSCWRESKTHKAELFIQPSLAAVKGWQTSTPTEGAACLGKHTNLVNPDATCGALLEPSVWGAPVACNKGSATPTTLLDRLHRQMCGSSSLQFRETTCCHIIAPRASSPLKAQSAVMVRQTLLLVLGIWPSGNLVPNHLMYEASDIFCIPLDLS